jgi:hypothetical protein
MLTARSIVLCAIGGAVLVLFATLVSIFQPPSQLREDSYGTRAYGYKAVYETITALGIDQQRESAPPSGATAKTDTYVFWAPQPNFVRMEPVYLERLRQWLRDGGRIVLSPQATRDRPEILDMPQELVKPTSALAELGLSGIQTKAVDLGNSSAGDGRITIAPHTPKNRNQQGVKEHFEDYLFPTLLPTMTAKVEAVGELKSFGDDVSSLELPTELQILDLSISKPDGTISIASGKQAEAQEQSAVIAALFQVGAGEIIVISDPAVFENRLLSQADNAVLAFNVLGKSGRLLLWDEFYHGLTIRGNPFYLLTRGTYALIAVMIVLATAVWVWRRSLFLGPPLATEPASRRSLDEYVTAMARFLHRGAASTKFMLSEVRGGVFWALQRKSGSSRAHDTPQDLAAVLKRRDPQAASQLLDAAHSADLILAQKSRPDRRELLQVTKDLLDCL